MNKASDVAVVIRDQIRSGFVPTYRSGTHAMMCWGFEKPLCDTDAQGQHSLIFKVSGMLFQGKVKVKLMHRDTYTIFTYAAGDADWTERQSDVYCDELTHVLHNIIENDA